MRVFVISIGFVPYPTPSDKQFVLDLVGELASSLDVFVWSLNDAEVGRKRFETTNGEVEYSNRNRVFHGPMFKDLMGHYQPHPSHSNIRNGLEIAVSMLFYTSALNRAISEYKPDIIHFTDSPGPLGYIIKALNPGVPITITKPTMKLSSGLRSSVYRLYVYFSLFWADRIITFTSAAKKSLNSAGINQTKVRVIPWGCFVPLYSNTENQREELRERYSALSHELLVLITDRVLGEGIRSLATSLAEANIKNVKFVISIRPTRFKKEYAAMSTGNVLVIKSPPDYYDLIEAADCLVSPIEDSSHHRTSLLPLVWINALMRGTPIITNPHPGAEDLVQDGKTGFFWVGLSQLVSILDGFHDVDSVSELSHSSRVIARKSFAMSSIASRYRSLWAGLKAASVHGG